MLVSASRIFYTSLWMVQRTNLTSSFPADGPNHWASREDQGEATAMILANLVLPAITFEVIKC